MAQLAERLAQFDSIESSAVKAYLRVCEHYSANLYGKPAFAHVEIALLTGRSAWLRSQMADALRKIIAEEFSDEVERDEIAITVEVREMDEDTYRR